MKQTKRKSYKEGQVLFNVIRKAFGKIVQISEGSKGTLFTIEYIDSPDDRGYGRYYSERLEQEFVPLKNTQLATILFSDL